MLPVPLCMDRYNPAFEGQEDEGTGDADGENGGDDDYLDPDRDYEAVAELRAGLLAQSAEEEEDD